jgi:putative endonuclease
MAAHAATHGNPPHDGGFEVGSEPLQHATRRMLMRTWRPKTPCVYIMASKPNGVLYTGVTSALCDRVVIHKQDLIDGFTKKYGVHRLVYYEMHETMEQAIRRESQIKKWKRAWKVRLIHEMNPEWRDLFEKAEGMITEGPADRARFYGHPS